MPHNILPLIQDTQTLAAFCTRLKAEPFITLDTEFIREKTYFPQLCLVQLAGTEEAAAIDPLTAGIDLQPLYELLADASVLKVLHAARQDLEIFYYAMGSVPTPLFDTQIAAQAAGFGESVSYAELAQRLTDARIDKASRFTDWAKRPLSDKQLSYAIGDVTHLHAAYIKLLAILEKQDRLDWVEEEMQAITEPSLYQASPETAWQRIRMGRMKPKQLAVLQALAQWREEEAIRRDVPRARLCRDEALVEMANSMPQTLEAMQTIRGLERINKTLLGTLAGVVAATLKTPPEDWPEQKERPKPSAEAQAMMELLTLLLKIIAAREGVVPRLIAGKDDLSALAEGERDLSVMRGWRHRVFGHYVDALIEGRLSLGYDATKGRIEITETPAPLA